MNPIDSILPKLQDVKSNPKGGWTALCPSHDDKQRSLSISIDDKDGVGLKCFASCELKSIVGAIGLKVQNLFPKNNKNSTTKNPVKRTYKKQEKLTLPELAKDKKLPLSTLKEFGLFQKTNYVQITYYLQDKTEAPRQRKRTAIKAKDGSLWNTKKGDILPYGLWKLQEAREKGYLILDEGESDCWTLWFHDFPALGIPGSGMANVLQIQYLQDISKIYILNEGGKPGDSFVNGIQKRLQEIQWHGKAFVITMPQGSEDANDLHKSNQSEFKELFQLSLQQAIPMKESLLIQQNQKNSNPLLKSEFQNLLISENDWQIPKGWALDSKGIYRIILSKDNQEELKRIAHYPFIISARSINIDSGFEQLELSFFRDKLLRQIWAERGQFLDQRSLSAFSNQGFPVTSRNSGQLVDYISDFEAANIYCLPKLLTVSAFGWKDYNNKHFFVLGDQAIGTKMNINFVPEGQGEKIFAKALKTKGSLDGWLKVARKTVPYPNALFGIYGGFTPPLLPLLEVSSFCVDYCGDSSIGKTTAIMGPASIYGDPVGDRGGIVPSWNATSVSIERYATLFNALPIFLDDSHLATAQQIKTVIYMISSGTGKMRGSLKGSQSLSSWQTVGFFTGENPVLSCTTHEGARARVIELQGSPFPGISGQGVSEIKTGFSTNFGHAGPLYLEKLLHFVGEKLDELKTKNESYCKILKNLAPSGIDNRKASYFAAVWTAATIAEELFEIGGNPNILIPTLFQELCGESISFAQKAMETVSSWVMGNWNNFDSGNGVLSGEAYGVIRNGEYVAIFPHKLADFLKKTEYSYEAVVRIFKEKGWIQTEARNLTVKIGFQGTSTRMIKIFWKNLVL